MWKRLDQHGALKAWHDRGLIFVRFANGHELSFPTKGNPRLEGAEEVDLGRIADEL